jgi:hypothetical protein
MILFAALALACVTACGTELDRPHNGPAGEGDVGAACSRDSDCIAELICVAELPGGACTRVCGGSSCPDGSLCVRTQLPTGGEMNVCAPLCDDATTPCRDGYSCVSVGRRSVCSY